MSYELQNTTFYTTGFDRRSSLVFTPTNPETSIEDCLAVMGDRVAKELDTSLAAAVHTLLTGPLDYQTFRDTTLALSTHTQGGWNKVLVPLVLLQALQCEGQSVTTLLHLGVRLLEEDEADYIIQQGGWMAIPTNQVMLMNGHVTQHVNRCPGRHYLIVVMLCLVFPCNVKRVCWLPNKATFLLCVMSQGMNG
ncbi:bcl-2-like protein 13 [Lates japonicus]|uniref:Bcl-2-like protein 13 n=1 Tax=Lates japonicus TaxID=270547 RepID=A0AAD3NL82_LATJO|nr:bcl-2-like protein 13 [Lates japonicus]